MRKPTKELNVKKASRFAVVVNLMQIIAMLALLLYVVFRAPGDERSAEILVISATLLVVTWGAILDIREARSADRIIDQTRILEQAYTQLEALNETLRKQRHDFMNHLQVVSALLELGETDEALRYTQNIYGDVLKVGSVPRTDIPAVNALIAAKRQDCEEHGIRLEPIIRSSWRELPVPGWEMCRVLGNLIDNARDALSEGAPDAQKQITLTIDENAEAFLCQIANNGPAIPSEQQTLIFRPGFTTRKGGHGWGLSIVRDILDSYGGSIRVRSNESETVFIVELPKPNKH